MEDQTIELSQNGRSYFFTKELAQKWKEVCDRAATEALRRTLIGSGYIPEEQDFVRLAWVYVGDERRMLGVHRDTMQGYVVCDNQPTIKIPLEKISYDRFERWCTLMDV